jgi:hypothetical protein
MGNDPGHVPRQISTFFWKRSLSWLLAARLQSRPTGEPLVNSGTPDS